MQISEVHKSLTAFNNRSTKSEMNVKNKGIRREWRTIKREEAEERAKTDDSAAELLTTIFSTED